MEQLLTLALGDPALIYVTPSAGKRQDAHRSPVVCPREMAALWALHPSALPGHPQLKEDEKLQLLRPETCSLPATVHHGSNKANDTPGKAQELSTLLYPEILLWFRLRGAAPL